MARTPAQAIAWAKTQHTGWNRLCLAFVRTAYGVASKYGRAVDAWNAAQHKHKTSDPKAIPAGVPVFMQGKNPAGHVAISLGGGQCYTTDDTVGGPRELPIATLVRVGYKLLGWTEDLNGVRVYTPPDVPGWFTVDVAKGSHLMGRAGASTSSKVKYRRARGFRIYAVKQVTAGGHTWLVTRYGTYYAKQYTKKG
ncbi:hypothetical protein GCM10025864_39760 [Luteimicrobium album]|uniref:CHAP domain-containing protein n=1 Tax=Luteimicrobium album TaxID=1054550 RepID=A0ABQ6I6F2_9MICO|nr:hypothetical protein [Luteimicrobium album]GMA26217.1 hypothetical protein GCM10025864_39760 [Luteimicrobium album]